MNAPTRAELAKKCTAYQQQRQATFNQRKTRFNMMYGNLRRMGLHNGDTVHDIGAGHCQFGTYLAYNQAMTIRYVAIDANIQGIDLNRDLRQEFEHWTQPDYAVAAEVIEHLENPIGFLEWLAHWGKRGALITTPNPAVVDALAIDPDHISPVTREDLESCGYHVVPETFFGKTDDTLLATIN